MFSAVQGSGVYRVSPPKTEFQRSTSEGIHLLRASGLSMRVIGLLRGQTAEYLVL